MTKKEQTAAQISVTMQDFADKLKGNEGIVTMDTLSIAVDHIAKLAAEIAKLQFPKP